MSENDVIVLLGVPHGQYYVGTADLIVPFGPANTTGRITTDHLQDYLLCETVWVNGDTFLFQRKGWIGDDLAIWILFNQDGVVLDKWSDKVTLIEE